MSVEDDFKRFLGRSALSLVRAHYEGDSAAFLKECRELAKRLDEMGKDELASFIRAQCGDEPSLVPMAKGGAK